LLFSINPGEVIGHGILPLGVGTEQMYLFWFMVKRLEKLREIGDI
jgi:hypothetical protein